MLGRPPTKSQEKPAGSGSAKRTRPGKPKGHVMSKRENEANKAFRSSDSPLTEYEKEKIARSAIPGWAVLAA